MKSYNFVSSYEDVDFDRILREAPKGVNFIVVEEKERHHNGNSIGYCVFIRNSFLVNEEIKGRQFLGEELGPDWGENQIDSLGKPLYLRSYRVGGAKGKYPKETNVKIEKLLSLLSPKNQITEVSYK